MKNLPSGAQALLIALNTPSPNGLIGIPTLLWGKPGVGKSSFIEGLATEKWKVLTIIASIYDPTDFSGLPIFENGAVNYAAPSWIDTFDDHEEGLLFFDELSTCPPSVQAALLRVVFERMVGFKPLPNHVRIIAAANPPDLVIGGWELTPPMRNRFVHLDWDISPNLFIHSLSNGWEEGVIPEIDMEKHKAVLPVWKDKVAVYLKINPGALHGDPEKETNGYASPRSWEYAIHLLASCEVLGLPPNFELIKGCLGEGTAVSLISFLENLRQPDPREVLNGDTEIDLEKMNDGELHILFNGMKRVIQTPEEEKNFLPFADRFLDLTMILNQTNRQDVIFVSLQNLARDGFLTKIQSFSELDSSSSYESFMKKITHIFSDEGLIKFIDVIS